MTFSKRIVIERYPEDMAQGCGYAGLIEGETEQGDRWIMWLDLDGKPQIFWPKRDEEGEVKGAPVVLGGVVTPSDGMRHLERILDSTDDPVEIVNRLRASVETAKQRIAESE